MSLLIGTSGWQYRHWRGGLYPAGLPQRRWLEHYATRFQTLEANNPFYRLPERETFAEWAARTPDDFVVALKMSRYLTHVRRLRSPEEPVGRFMERVEALGAKLGPVLLQLPPNLPVDLAALGATLSCFPPSVRVAVEVRHGSWAVPELASLLAERRAALCLADQGGPSSPLWRTTDWGYVRLHAGRASPFPCYGRRALGTWAERLAARWSADEEVFCFLNNDGRGCAVRDARWLALAAQRTGLRPTRVPDADEAPVR
ncbi:MAG TPA: DUF72 domain-containing protein [Acidimicrobiales bacterium]|nr:DUF72 domain-containing protein [Acidimicrobiales bacterium]